MSLVDVCFTASNRRPPKGVVKTGLNRAEFIEVLVRIAIQKHKSQAPTVAFKKFLDEDIMSKWNPITQWAEFRSRYLWTLDVNDVF